MLLCRADTERKLTVTLASFLNPDTVVILDQEHVDDTEEEPEIPDWCPTQNCFATGKAAFKVETNEGSFVLHVLVGFRWDKDQNRWDGSQLVGDWEGNSWDRSQHI